MAQIKISQLEELTSVSDNDVFASVDTANSKTKKAKASTLKKYVKENLNYSEVAGKPSINGTELLGNKTLQELGIQPAGDYALNSALKSYSLITETGNKISLTINSSTYVMTLQLKDKNGSVLSTGTIDLPLETMVVGATYNADTQEIELTLKNGSKVSFSVADLVDGLVNEDDLNDTLQDYALKTSIPTKLSQLAEDSTHRLVTDTEKATWNNKVDKVSGKGLSTNDFTNELKSKLDGIEDNAQVNKIEKISVDGVEQEISEDKEVNIKSYDITKYFYNALTYNQAKGNDLTFEDSIEFPLGKLDMDGKSEQVTTTGKNLYNKDTDIIGKAFSNSGVLENSVLWNTSDYIYVDKDSYMLSSKTTNSRNIFFSEFDENKTFIKRTSTYNIIPQENTRYLCISYRNDYGIYDIMLEEGSSATEYEPYTGGQPSPSPDYPQEINSIEGDLEYIDYANKNFLNVNNDSVSWRASKIETFDGCYVKFNKSDLTSPGITVQRFTDYQNVFLPKDKELTLITQYISGVNNFDGNFQPVIYIYFKYDDNTEKNIDFYPNNSNTLNSGYYKKTFTPPKNIIGIALGVYVMGDGHTMTDLVYGLSVGYGIEEFEPSKVRTLTIPTNGQVFRKVGDVADKLIVDMKTGDYYKEKNIEEIILNGSENWKSDWQNIGTPDYIQFYLSSNYLNNNYLSFNNNAISNYLRITNTVWPRNYEAIGINEDKNYSLQIKFKKSRISNLQELKNWLLENNVIVDYQLETPILEKIGTLTKEQLDMLVTFKGYNNVMINTNLGQADIDIEYVLDMKKYIDNKIAEISAQMI